MFLKLLEVVELSVIAYSSRQCCFYEITILDKSVNELGMKEKKLSSFTVLPAALFNEGKWLHCLVAGNVVSIKLLLEIFFLLRIDSFTIILVPF